jgi:hypothetical protein
MELPEELAMELQLEYSSGVAGKLALFSAPFFVLHQLLAVHLESHGVELVVDHRL